MAIKDEKTLADFETAPDGVDKLFHEKAVTSDNLKFRKNRPMLFVVSILLSLLILICVYLSLGVSKVKAISVIGNNYLSKEYVEKLINIDYDSIFYLVFPSKTSRNLAKDPMIEEAKVKLMPGNLVQITIKEKQPFGYRYDEDKPKILFVDDTSCDLTSDYMPMISRIPLIKGFNQEQQTHLLSVAFGKVKPEMIDNIAEVSQYKLSFDNQALQVQMRDGMYFFSNYYSLEIINDYNDMVSHITKHDKCFFADSSRNVAYYKACPWDEKPVEREYWMREDGSYIKNKWGDKVVKHYYTDKNGNFYLDKQGNKILIPIDKYGLDIVDKNFYQNFMDGYYDTGTLILPEEDDEQDEEKDDESKKEDDKKDTQNKTDQKKNKNDDSNKDSKKDKEKKASN